MGSVSSSHPSSLATVLKDRKKREASMKRRAIHAGSWYTDNTRTLDSTLEAFLTGAEETTNKEGDASSYTVDSTELEKGVPKVIQSTKEDTELNTNTSNVHSIKNEEGIPKAIVAPHAGYSYSGETAGYAYAALREAFLMGCVERIIVLHPSHHIRLDGCAISGVNYLCTPLGDLTVDSAIRDMLLETGSFTTLERQDDEREHSGEMQYPFIYKALSTNNKSEGQSLPSPEQIPVLPIMVGNMSSSLAEKYGQILAPIIAKPKVFTVISTDFCHWGTRFHYSPFDQTKANHIYQYIQLLDNAGMDRICMQDPGAFTKYLKQTRNTICGRFPITVWLNAVKANREKGLETLHVQFVRYAQSSNIRSESESSVSYASGVARLSSTSSS